MSLGITSSINAYAEVNGWHPVANVYILWLAYAKRNCWLTAFHCGNKKNLTSISGFSHIPQPGISNTEREKNKSYHAKISDQNLDQIIFLSSLKVWKYWERIPQKQTKNLLYTSNKFEKLCTQRRTLTDTLPQLWYPYAPKKVNQIHFFRKHMKCNTVSEWISSMDVQPQTWYIWHI